MAVNPLPDLLAALISGVGGIPGHVTPTQLSSNNATLSSNLSLFLSDTGANIIDTRPRAFVNWVLFDNQMNCVSSSSGFDQVGGNEEFKHHILSNLQVDQSGYLYIYLSNETPNIDVFFDNFQVTHVRGPMLEEDHYYPFGLTMAGISDKALKTNYAENKYRYNKGSELQNKEFADGTGLELYATEFRPFDPQIGRFIQIDELSHLDYNYSPYSYANNNPILFNDPSGLAISDSTHPQILPTATVTAKKPLDTKNGQVYGPQSFLAHFWSGNRTWMGHLSIGNETRILNFEVDQDGYLTGRLKPNELIFTGAISDEPLDLREVFNLKNFIKRQYVVYKYTKNGLPYIGKALESLIARYGSAEKVAALGADVIKGLENIPSNAVALGVEQLVIDLNGGVGTGELANKINATVKQIYIGEARYWLDTNIPNWEQILKFK